MKSGISIFDVDRTLTRRPTYSAFLFYGALRTSPWRLLLLPLLIPYAIAYALNRISRKQMKEAMHMLALGKRLRRERANRLAEGFARSLVEDGVFREAFEAMAAERRDGRRIVLATAAPELYIAPFARLVGADAILATKSSWDCDFLTPQIAGENCYGVHKFDMIREWLELQNIQREKADIRFFSDHASDLPTFEWADEPVMVNPSRRLQEIGSPRGWRKLDWKSSDRSRSTPPQSTEKPA